MSDRMLSDEILLGLIKKNGGGGGGTTNYNDLNNKPQINGVNLIGDKSASDLGLASEEDVARKQDTLTAGKNINLSNNEVKAGVFVEAGVDVDIDEYSIQSGTETYTIAESGLYEIFYCLTLQSAVSLSLPESANVLIERDLSISNHPVKHIVAELAAGSTVTITQTPNQWRTVMSGILKLDAISVNNVVHTDSIADSSVSYKLPNDDKYYLVIGTAVGNAVASNSTRDDTSGGNPTIVKTQSAEYAKFRSVIVKGSDSPNFSFYGYDGGVAAIIAFDVSLEEGNWDYNLVAKDYVDAAINAIKDGQSIDSFADVETALGEKADTDIVASEFSAATSYTAGNYCIYEGKFYKFKANHSGAWSAADVDEIKIAGELATLKSGLIKISDTETKTTSASGSTVLTSRTGRHVLGVRFKDMGSGKSYVYELGQAGDTVYLHITDESGVPLANEEITFEYVYITY